MEFFCERKTKKAVFVKENFFQDDFLHILSVTFLALDFNFNFKFSFPSPLIQKMVLLL